MAWIQTIFSEYKTNRYYRLFLQVLISLAFSLIWFLLVMSGIIHNSLSLLILILLVSVLLTALITISIESSFRSGFILRLIGISVVWIGLILCLNLFLPLLISGLVANGVVLLCSMVLSTWLVVVEPSEHYLHRKYYKNSFLFQFLENGVTHELSDNSQNTSDVDITTLIQERIGKFVPQLPDTLSEKFFWIAPLDQLSLFWDSRLIKINKVYSDITTREGYIFNIHVQFSLSFIPSKLTAEALKINLPKFTSIDDVEELFRSIIQEALEPIIRRHFVEMAYQKAVGAGTIKQFASALPEKLSWADTYLGLSVISYSVNVYPIISENARTAADKASASAHNTVADLAIQKELVNQVMLGSIPAQFALYAQLAANNNHLRYAPDTNRMPEVNIADRLLYALRDGEKQKALQLLASGDSVSPDTSQIVLNRLTNVDAENPNNVKNNTSSRGFNYDELD